MSPRKSICVDINWGLRFYKMDAAESFIYEMCKEVAKRMEGVVSGMGPVPGCRGRTVTMKLKKRSENESVNPSKFLGCGRCDSFSK
jgi:DNA repair protein REV1